MLATICSPSPPALSSSNQPTQKKKTPDRDPKILILSIRSICSDDGRQFGFPLVPVSQELLLVVQQLLPRLRGVLRVGRLDDGIYGAGFLAETAVYALGHVDVVTCRSS